MLVMLREVQVLMSRIQMILSLKEATVITSLQVETSSRLPTLLFNLKRRDAKTIIIAVDC